MIEMQQVFTTDFGQFTQRDIPAELWERLASAKWRNGGLPDGRSPNSKQAWADLNAWALQRYLDS